MSFFVVFVDFLLHLCRHWWQFARTQMSRCSRVLSWSGRNVGLQGLFYLAGSMLANPWMILSRMGPDSELVKLLTGRSGAPGGCYAKNLFVLIWVFRTGFSLENFTTITVMVPFQNENGHLSHVKCWLWTASEASAALLSAWRLAKDAAVAAAVLLTDPELSSQG